MMTDLVTLLNHRGDTDLVEAFCSDDPMMTNAERWTVNDYDLSTESGFAQAEQRLRSIRPRRRLVVARVWAFLSDAKRQSEDTKES